MAPVMSAHALCNTPAGDEGDIFYNTTTNTVQFCNGENWYNAGAIKPDASGASCNRPEGPEGAIFYNARVNAAQFCNGEAWVNFGTKFFTDATGTVCTNPSADEGTIFYNNATKTLQFCNGDNWINAVFSRIVTGEPLYTEWQDIGGLSWSAWSPEYSCSTMSNITQTRDATQYQERQVQQRELDSLFGTYTNIGSPVTENRTVPVSTESQTVYVNYTDWNNNGGLTGCSAWTPSENSVLYGREFTRTRTCSQNQIRYRRYHNTTNPNVYWLSCTDDTRTNSVDETETATGTLCTGGPSGWQFAVESHHDGYYREYWYYAEFGGRQVEISRSQFNNGYTYNGRTWIPGARGSHNVDQWGEYRYMTTTRTEYAVCDANP